ncbi:NmrA family transcriptional regulator [Metarhizium acridum CQMa 102]|uniref:NmrA family transcriptional regulator n=1 Tax=Metarhizium acridum (strain CQMa 102) TaxID=655827 RepID=E9DXJ8_METAQ|nr:NmrA family transcriptional regulator [Metarhizium acridum CQMa 102]EFY91756.1 NmrA family transcriptional regulator [Metarhizium acridum CQMa 102]
MEAAQQYVPLMAYFLCHKLSVPLYQLQVAAIEELLKTELQYTRFIASTFMDYFGPRKAPSQLTVLPLFIDHESREATISGGRNTPVALTHSTDVGKFIAAALDFPTGARNHIS